jgi:hypothetical protein
VKAHILYDKEGAIGAVVFQATELDGELEIQPQEGQYVTTVDLSVAFPENSADTGVRGAGSEDPSRQLYLIARNLRNGYRVDPRGKRLEKRR